MVSINLANPLSIEHNTNSSLGLVVKYVAKKTALLPLTNICFCVGYVFLSNTEFFNLRRCSTFCSQYILQILTLVNQHTYAHRLCNTLPEVKTRVLSWWKETLFFWRVFHVSRLCQFVSCCLCFDLMHSLWISQWQWHASFLLPRLRRTVGDYEM